MDREVLTKVKLKLVGGYTTPAPPVGPALGQHGVNIGQFCRQFNDRTQGQEGVALSAVVTIFKDKSFEFAVKKPTATYLLKQAAEVLKGSGRPSRDAAGFITQRQLRKIAEIKLPDLNTSDLEAATKIIAGTARSMGIKIIQ